MASWWKPWQERPHQKYRATSGEADQLDAAGRSDEAATLRLNAIISFSRKASTDQLIRYAPDIQHNLVVAASQHPGDAMRTLAELDLACPPCVSGNTIMSVVRNWVSSTRMDKFGKEFSALMALLTSKNQDLPDVLLAACRNVPRDALTDTFCHGVTAYLWGHLDQHLQLASAAGRRALDGHNSAFQLLDVVGPRHLSRAGQVCVLGDIALARASPAEASARYQVAVNGGSQQASERLAYQHAREGHRLLSAGNILAARRRFAEACRLHKDREYAFFGAIAELLSDDADTGVVLDQLEALDGPGAPAPHIAFWRALAHLRRGESDDSIALLRRLDGHHGHQGDGNQSWGPVEEGAALLAVLEGNDHVLVDSAQHLVRTHGEGWLSAGPADPLPMVGAVARHDQGLLGTMVALVSNPNQLPEWVRIAGAHALLTRSVASARKGQAGEAMGDAELGQRLLRG